MLQNLVIAVESEAQIVDIGRVSGFMQKVMLHHCRTSLC
jgi:regulatory protein SWI6